MMVDKSKEDRMKGSGKCFYKGDYWLEHELWESARIEKLKPFEIPLASIEVGHLPWDMNDLEDFMYHKRKVEQADLKYPITLNDKGVIIDGYHRICKAIMRGNKTIKAVRFDYMPPKSGTENE